MPQKEDSMIIEILPDGTIKSEVEGHVSPANHSNAEAFFRLLDEMTGSKGRRTRRKDAKIHVHHGEHTHEGH